MSRRPVRRLMEFSDFYTLAAVHRAPEGSITFERAVTEHAIAVWSVTARGISSWYDDRPNVVRTVLPAMGVVQLRVIGWYED